MNHADLVLRVRGSAHSAGSRLVRTIVKNLKSKLGDHAKNPACIFNAPRIGWEGRGVRSRL